MSSCPGRLIIRIKKWPMVRGLRWLHVRLFSALALFWQHRSYIYCLWNYKEIENQSCNTETTMKLFIKQKHTFKTCGNSKVTQSNFIPKRYQNHSKYANDINTRLK